MIIQEKYSIVNTTYQKYVLYGESYFDKVYSKHSINYLIIAPVERQKKNP